MSELNVSIGIYQPLFGRAVREYLDPGFMVLDWLGNPAPELRELALHHHILQSRLFERHDLTGLFSPKFFSKTGLTSCEVKDWVKQNPGHDVYCFDGRPFVPYTHYNSIERGVINHPEFEDLTRRVCRAIGFDLPSELGRQTNQQAILCNFWCASPSFWERWSREIVLPIFELVQSDAVLARKVFCKLPYRSPTPVFLIVFIYERMMSYFIQIKGINAAMFPWTAERILGLNWASPMREYLVHNIPWIDELDRCRRWTSDDRAKLADAYSELVSHADIRAHEADTFNPHNYDLPARKLPPKALKHEPSPLEGGGAQ
ncbi:MAG: hypothetical protein E7813_14340 [Bradyrhizobium sp.]|uniref:hypothetical protein n=1 Tax=Bradyrhizobium sp. TaxID=376 RepID=UPI001211DDEB|nr:hypothetical protein [Bradyrhizobium sp.]THD65569.1 MAG: hypothetical protein E7813_14340 [Bradyrhizobium sp.]